MQISVPSNIVFAAFGGDVSPLTRVASLYASLQDALQEAQEALHADIAQVLADGLARAQGAQGAAQMVILDSGELVVRIGGEGVVLKADPVTDPVTLEPETPAVSRAALPPIGEIRKRAEAAGVDITDLDGRNQKEEMLARIEKAEGSLAPVPVAEVAKPTTRKPVLPDVKERANKAYRIASSMLGEGAEHETISRQALDIMDWSDMKLDAAIQRIEAASEPADVVEPEVEGHAPSEPESEGVVDVETVEEGPAEFEALAEEPEPVPTEDIPVASDESLQEVADIINTEDAAFSLDDDEDESLSLDEGDDEEFSGWLD